jgi:outer membrane protein assembly factor BamB
LPALGDDWPQWRGPDRTGVSKENGLLKDWPAKGPRLVWTYSNAGVGFSTTAVVGDRLYTLGGIDESEYVIALDLKGTQPRELWKVKLGPILIGHLQYGDGPRSTPTVDGKLLYALGGQGDLVCVALDKGQEVWRKNLIKDLGGEMMTEWGYSESPLVDGDKLICTPGGDKGTLAALDKKTGAVRWRSTGLKNKAPYSSVVISEAGGVRQYVQNSYISEDEGGVVSGFDAKDGKVLWTAPLAKISSYAIVPTPIVRGDLVYVTAGYDYGCHLYQLKRTGDGFAVNDLYKPRERRAFKNTHGGVVLVGEHVYGHSEKTGWVCQDFKTGKVAWLERDKLECTSGSITAADGMLYLYSDEGVAVLLSASPKGWEEHGHFEIPQKSKVPEMRRGSRGAKIWTQPVIANGRLYLRDQELLFCFDISAKK